jgi:signal transduction histidine kinase
MLRNLFENARRHGQGTPIDASVEATDMGVARIVVSDTGPGVPETERERIFTPFYRATGVSDGGSGLGLALVREIARHHGGDARYRPREGGGSCFEVTLTGRSSE